MLLLLYHARYLSHSDPAKLRSTPFKDGSALVPKLADPLSSWKSGSTPLYSGSGILDPDWLIFYTIYTFQLYEINYLETRSRHFNTSFIIIGFQCPSSDAFSRSRQSQNAWHKRLCKCTLTFGFPAAFCFCETKKKFWFKKETVKVKTLIWNLLIHLKTKNLEG